MFILWQDSASATTCAMALTVTPICHPFVEQTETARMFWKAATIFRESSGDVYNRRCQRENELMFSWNTSLETKCENTDKNKEKNS